METLYWNTSFKVASGNIVSKGPMLEEFLNNVRELLFKWINRGS